jgi:hypothetical protein
MPPELVVPPALVVPPVPTLPPAEVAPPKEVAPPEDDVPPLTVEPPLLAVVPEPDCEHPDSGSMTRELRRIPGTKAKVLLNLIDDPPWYRLRTSLGSQWPLANGRWQRSAHERQKRLKTRRRIRA